MSNATVNAQEIDFEACLKMEQEIDEMKRLLSSDSWFDRLKASLRQLFKR